MAEKLSDAFARRLAERDNPPPPPPLSQEPAAVQARVAAWLLATHNVRDQRARLRQSRMLLALIQHPERTTAALAEAAALGVRGAARTAGHLHARRLVDWEERGLCRYWRLTRPAEDALLLVVVGPAV
ncbi:hypothetical protein GCM10022409_43820 [Hymenobacter glaciei]|uniref:HTH marR-type domain-containing protein n=1 Tax=Hymenobacter glaciei TaxID=877209 RepID=A0ABP7UTC3_9BACT